MSLYLSRAVSSSRTYVVACTRGSPEGYYFRKFILPETAPSHQPNMPAFPLKNHSAEAAWYFLAHLGPFAEVKACYTWEDFSALLGVSARLDTEGTAKPLSCIISHPPAGMCLGPDSLFHSEYQDEKGKRIPLK